MTAHSSLIYDEELAREIADVEIVNAADVRAMRGWSRWLMEQPLANKAKLAATFSLGGMTVITALALAGFYVPSFAATAQILMIVVLSAALVSGIASVRFVLSMSASAMAPVSVILL